MDMEGFLRSPFSVTTVTSAPDFFFLRGALPTVLRAYCSSHSKESFILEVSRRKGSWEKTERQCDAFETFDSNSNFAIHMIAAILP